LVAPSPKAGKSSGINDLLAVEAVNSEPVSDPSFPDNREITGNFAQFDASRVKTIAIQRGTSAVYTRIPCAA
jgi:hypothetical protein